jgi:hypothetical protein
MARFPFSSWMLADWRLSLIVQTDEFLAAARS